MKTDTQSAGQGLTLSPEFKYRGGPVMRKSAIHRIYIGTSMSNLMGAFCVQLDKSPYANLLAQYGIEAINLGDTRPVPNFSPTESAFKAFLKEHAVRGSYNLNLILLDESQGLVWKTTRVGNVPNPNAFGFHDCIYFGFQPVYFAVIPALTDAQVKAACPGASMGGCSLKLPEKQFDRITQVASHEIAEALTDPEVPYGWSAGSGGEEVGDICNGSSTTEGVPGYVTQTIYSLASDHAGGSWCQDGAPQPLPEIKQSVGFSDMFGTVFHWLWMRASGLYNLL